MLDKLFDKLPYEKLEKVSFAQFMMAAFGVGAFLIVIYVFTLYSDGRQDLTALLAKKAAVEKKLKEDEMLLAQTGAVTRALAMFVQDLSAAKRQMPGADEMPRLLRKVSETEKDLSMEILLLKVEEGKVKDYYKEIPLSIQIRGGFWNAVGFFDKLQDLLQAVTFSELKIEKFVPKAKTKESSSNKPGRTAGAFDKVEVEDEVSATMKASEREGTAVSRGTNKGATLENFENAGLATKLVVQVTAKTFAYIEGSEDREPPAPPAPPAPPPPQKKKE